MRLFFFSFSARVLEITLVKKKMSKDRKIKDILCILWEWLIFTYHFIVFKKNVQNAIVLDSMNQQSS